VSDIDITPVDSPKALDPNRPIREADIEIKNFEMSALSNRQSLKRALVVLPGTVVTGGH
jgi:hypothetical protein